MIDEELRWLKPGTPIRKVTGDYQWDGEICSVFLTPASKLRAVVAHAVDNGYVLHIYSAANLERVKE